LQTSLTSKTSKVPKKDFAETSASTATGYGTLTALMTNLYYVSIASIRRLHSTLAHRIWVDITARIGSFQNTSVSSKIVYDRWQSIFTEQCSTNGSTES
jgi:hypothetical protein